MQGQTLFGLIAFIALCHNGIEATRFLVCEGGKVNLYCAQGFIKVSSASYGRSDRYTCSNGQRAYKLRNTQCHQYKSLRIMSDRCDGMPSCVVPVTNSVFSDPCRRTYKYLDVSYKCVLASRSLTCENAKNDIRCSSGTMVIHHANYGRRDKQICYNNKAKTSDCYQSQTDYLSHRCNGRSSCALYASNSVFSDPCRRVSKYLEVTYSCGQPPQLNMMVDTRGVAELPIQQPSQQPPQLEVTVDTRGVVGLQTQQPLTDLITASEEITAAEQDK